LPLPLPLPPSPPAAPAMPASQAAARQALVGVEQSRQQAIAAAEAAAAMAAAASAKQERLAKARRAVTLRLSLAESATEELALRANRLARQRAAAEARLTQQARTFAPLLPLLERLSLYPASTLLAVPAPPEEALRGLLVLQEMAGTLERDAARLRAEEARVKMLAAKVAETDAELKKAEAAQAAEAAVLDHEIVLAHESRTAAIGQQAAAEAAAAAAAAHAKTLEGAIAAIAAAARRAEAARHAEAARRAAAARAAVAAARRQQVAFVPPPPPRGALPPAGTALGAPVAGVLVSSFGAPTPAGPASGVRYQTAPGAHVLAPCTGNVEFAAPFRSYGRLVILDCGDGYRFVLAGMQRLLVQAGSQVSAGEAVGVMAEWNPGSPGPRPTLYLELHHGAGVVNPLPRLHGRG